MKIGCCLGVSPDSFENLIKVKETGVKFIEASLVSLSKLSDEDIARLDEITTSLTMPCTAANCMFPSEIKLVGKNVDYGPAEEYLFKAFDKIVGTKIKHITFGSGGARRCPDTISHEKATEQLTAFLSDVVAPAVAKYGFVCGIESLNSTETNIFTACSETFKVVKAINKPQIRMIVDYYHFAKENESLASLKEYKGYVSHMHIASLTTGRQAPMPVDNENYAAFINAMREIGCGDGNLAIEGGIPEPFYKTLKTSVAYLNTLGRIVRK